MISAYKEVEDLGLRLRTSASSKPRLPVEDSTAGMYGGDSSRLEKEDIQNHYEPAAVGATRIGHRNQRFTLNLKP